MSLRRLVEAVVAEQEAPEADTSELDAAIEALEETVATLTDDLAAATATPKTAAGDSGRR